MTAHRCQWCVGVGCGDEGEPRLIQISEHVRCFSRPEGTDRAHHARIIAERVRIGTAPQQAIAAVTCPPCPSPEDISDRFGHLFDDGRGLLGEPQHDRDQRMWCAVDIELDKFLTHSELPGGITQGLRARAGGFVQPPLRRLGECARGKIPFGAPVAHHATPTKRLPRIPNNHRRRTTWLQTKGPTSHRWRSYSSTARIGTRQRSVSTPMVEHACGA
jgi:hypothetical protein